MIKYNQQLWDELVLNKNIKTESTKFTLNVFRRIDLHVNTNLIKKWCCRISRNANTVKFASRAKSWRFHLQSYGAMSWHFVLMKNYYFVNQSWTLFWQLDRTKIISKPSRNTITFSRSFCTLATHCLDCSLVFGSWYCISVPSTVTKQRWKFYRIHWNSCESMEYVTRSCFCSPVGNMGASIMGCFFNCWSTIPAYLKCLRYQQSHVPPLSYHQIMDISNNF